MTENKAQIAQKLLAAAGLSGLADSLPSLPEGCYALSPSAPELKDNYIFYYPKTLEDIRRVAGVPLEIANANRDKMQLPQHLSERKTQIQSADASNALDDITLRDLATELLLFPLEQDQVETEDGPYAQALAYMLQHAEVLPVLLADNLTVKDGETYTITKTATAVFGSITVHGTGCIAVDSDIKVFADSITHIL